MQPWPYRLMASWMQNLLGPHHCHSQGCFGLQHSTCSPLYLVLFVSLLAVWVWEVVSCVPSAEATLGEALAFPGLHMPKATVTHHNFSCTLGTIPPVLQFASLSAWSHPQCLLPLGPSLKISTPHPFLYFLCCTLSLSTLYRSV